MDNEAGSEPESAGEAIPFLETELRHFKLTKDNLKILRDYWKQWQDNKGLARTAIAVKAYKEMIAKDPRLCKTSRDAKEAHKLKREVSVRSM